MNAVPAAVQPERLLDAQAGEQAAGIGAEAHALCADLYPLCRSLTGNGVRQTLHRLREVIPLQIQEAPSGSQAFDWTVPDEWNIRDACVLDGSGRRVIDFKASNLHVIGNSAPIDALVTREELLAHLHNRSGAPRLDSLPAHLLPRLLGILCGAPPARDLDRGAVPGAHRFNPRARQPDLWRVPAAGH